MADFVVWGPGPSIDILGISGTSPNPGEIPLDKVQAFVGGSTANIVVGCQRLGVTSAHITSFGGDCFGEICYEAYESEGIDVSLSVKAPTLRTYVAFVLVERDSGRRTIFSADRPLTWDNLEFPEIPDSYLKDAKVFGGGAYVGSMRQDSLRLLEKARSLGVKTYLDPGEDPGTNGIDSLGDVIQLTDILLPGIREARWLSGEHDVVRAGYKLLSMGPELVALKLGAEGCILFYGDEHVYIPGFAVAPVDLTGAGDGFAAGLIAGYIMGWDPVQMGTLANATAAMNISAFGPRSGLPSLESVKVFMKEKKEQRNYMVI